MAVYWSLFFLTIFLAWFISNTELCYEINIPWKTTERKMRMVAVVFIILPTIFFLGLRSKVGDTAGYIEAFDRTATAFSMENLDERAYGYSILQKFCKAYLFDDASLWLILLVLISIIPIIINIQKFSPSVVISLFVFFASTEFVFLINGARQFIAVCISFYALKYLVNKNYIKYYLIVLLAMSFHMTAIVMLVAYPIAIMKPFKSKIFIFCILTTIIIIFSDEFLHFANDAFISNSVYGHYMVGLDKATGVNIVRVLTHWVPVVLAFIYRKSVYEIDDRCMNICVNFSLINAFVFTFASTLGGNLTGRMAEYFTIYNLLLYPMLFVRSIPKNTKRWLLPMFFIIYICFFIFQMEIVWGGLEYESDLLDIYC